MILCAFFKVKELRTEQLQNSAPVNHVPPPVLPHQTFSLRLRELLSIVKTQEDRLFSLRKDANIFIFKDKIRAFKQRVAQCGAAEEAVKRYADLVVKGGDVFEKAWKQFKTLFAALAECYGGLACVFSGAATV